MPDVFSNLSRFACQNFPDYRAGTGETSLKSRRGHSRGKFSENPPLTLRACLDSPIRENYLPARRHFYKFFLQRRSSFDQPSQQVFINAAFEANFTIEFDDRDQQIELRPKFGNIIDVNHFRNRHVWPIN